VTRLREIVLLGSTGSIGTQAVDVVLRNPGRFRVVALAASGSRPELLADQVARLRVRTVAVADLRAVDAVRAALARRGAQVENLLAGEEAPAQVAASACDVVLNGITGAVGLGATVAALTAGRTLALANKESLIMGGPLVTALAGPGQLVPVDSEHSALAQCLRGGAHGEVRRLLVTASGGPFRGRGAEELRAVTPEQALAHPTWSMGPVITVNSATLVNKGLEVIEAHLLFGIPFERIEVVVHPQSVVHSMVEFTDGSTLAQCSPPDMRLPIALGLAWPDRVPGAVPGCDFTQAARWEFFPLDEQAFPAVSLARECGRRGRTYPAVYNAANEVCVDAFLKGRIRFTDIVGTVAAVVEAHTAADGDLTVAEVLDADRWARAEADAMIGSGRRTVSATAVGTGAMGSGGEER